MGNRLLIFTFCFFVFSSAFASNDRQCIEVINLFLAKQNLGSYDKPKKHKSSKTYDVKALGMLAYERFVTKLTPDELNKISSCAAWAIAEKRQGLRDVSKKLKEKVMKHMEYNDGYENDPAMEVPMHQIFSKAEKIELAFLAIGGSCDKNEEMSIRFNNEYIDKAYPNKLVYNLVDGSFAENATLDAKVVEVTRFTEDNKFVVAKENSDIRGFAFYEGDSSHFYSFNKKCEVENMEVECSKSNAIDLLCKPENRKYLAIATKPYQKNKPEHGAP